jgi:hypothetical protein
MSFAGLKCRSKKTGHGSISKKGASVALDNELSSFPRRGRPAAKRRNYVPVGLLLTIVLRPLQRGGGGFGFPFSSTALS